VVVDDEPIARRRLVTMLSREAGVEVVGECDDGATAAPVISSVDPDIVFLDVRMPEIDGFTLLSVLPRSRRPVIVFVTAYAEHAVRAFDVDAVDYLLKPYDRLRLAKALARARMSLASVEDRQLRAEVRALADTVRDVVNASAPTGEGALEASPRAAGSSRALDRVAVTIGRRTIFVPVLSIDWIRADRNYLELHVGSRAFLIRSSVAAFEARLDPASFARIHRSLIVRVDAVRELHTVAPGLHKVMLADGTQLPVSAAYRNRLPQG
jgi:two-component system LytT family response regulator